MSWTGSDVHVNLHVVSDHMTSCVCASDFLSRPGLGGLPAGLGSAQGPRGVAPAGPDPRQQGEDQQQLQLLLLH